MPPPDPSPSPVETPPGESREELVVRLSEVTFGYDREVILDRVDLEIRRSDFLAVIGPNGGGKTTLLKVILGLVRPWSGRVEVRLDRRGGRLGYVPQFAGFERDFPLRVRDAVLMGRLGRRRLLERYDRSDRAAVERELERFRLGHLAREPVAELSGGQLQRMLIARALAGEPEILFLDEPLASVDAESREVLISTLRELDRTIPVVVVTHDLTPYGGIVRQVACVNRQLHYHPHGEVTGEMLEQVYGCPVELVAHGVPHRVLADHAHPPHAGHPLPGERDG